MKNHDDDEEDYISRLNRTMVDLKNAILEKDRILKAEGFEIGDPQLNREIENLKKQKRECNEIIRRLRVELSESEKREDRLREKNVEACATLEELTRQKLAVEARLATRIRREQSEADHTVAELAELRRQNLESRRALEEVTRKLSEADCSVEELKKQNLVARNAARLYRKKFEGLNVKIDELVNVKNDSVVDDDVDDEGFMANINAYVNLGETGIGLEGFGSGDSSNRTINKRNVTMDCSGDSVVTKKGKKGSVLGNENDEPHVINRRVVRFRNISEKKWTCGAHMLKAFDEDDELCMDAVCALHRKQVSIPGSNLVESHFQTMRGYDLAEYLIDGDPKLRRKKSVSEVKNRCPDVVNRCRILAANYYEKLFMMYCNGDDPFFGPL